MQQKDFQVALKRFYPAVGHVTQECKFIGVLNAAPAARSGRVVGSTQSLLYKFPHIAGNEKS